VRLYPTIQLAASDLHILFVLEEAYAFCHGLDILKIPLTPENKALLPSYSVANMAGVAGSDAAMADFAAYDRNLRMFKGLLTKQQESQSRGHSRKASVRSLQPGCQQRASLALL